MNKKALTERDICSKFITPALTSAGWESLTQIREQVHFTKGRIIVRGRLVTRGQSKPLGVCHEWLESSGGARSAAFSPCPVDLRKLHHATGFDVVERYERLAVVAEDLGFREAARWNRAGVESLAGVGNRQGNPPVQ